MRLAPDLIWDSSFGLGLVLWFVAPAVTPLPADQVVVEATSIQWLEAVGGLVSELELHVVPTSAGRHDEAIAAVQGLVEGGGPPLLGGMPRWMRVPDWQFAPVWRAPIEEGPALLAVGAAVQRLDAVAVARVVPGEPRGLEEVWPVVDPAWRSLGNRWFVRCRDGLTDRDRLVRVSDREPRPEDAEVAGAVHESLDGLRPDAWRGWPVRPVQDATGRPGFDEPGRVGRVQGGPRARRLRRGRGPRERGLLGLARRPAAGADVGCGAERHASRVELRGLVATGHSTLPSTNSPPS